MPSNKLIVLPSSPETSESYSAADEEIGRAEDRATGVGTACAHDEVADVEQCVAPLDGRPIDEV